MKITSSHSSTSAVSCSTVVKAWSTGIYKITPKTRVFAGLFFLAKLFQTLFLKPDIVDRFHPWPGPPDQFPPKPNLAYIKTKWNLINMPNRFNLRCNLAEVRFPTGCQCKVERSSTFIDIVNVRWQPILALIEKNPTIILIKCCLKNFSRKLKSPPQHWPTRS